MAYIKFIELHCSVIEDCTKSQRMTNNFEAARTNVKGESLDAALFQRLHFNAVRKHEILSKGFLQPVRERELRRCTRNYKSESK